MGPTQFQQDKKATNIKIGKPEVAARTYKVNINDVRQRFLAELVYLFFYKILLKFPDNMQLQLFANYFTIKFRCKELLTIFQLRSFPKHKLSFVDQACYMINEQFLLWEVSQKERNDYFERVVFASSDMNKLDGDYFIKINELHHEFSMNIEGLGQTVMNFWRNL